MDKMRRHQLVTTVIATLLTLSTLTLIATECYALSYTPTDNNQLPEVIHVNSSDSNATPLFSNPYDNAITNPHTFMPYHSFQLKIPARIHAGGIR